MKYYYENRIVWIYKNLYSVPMGLKLIYVCPISRDLRPLAKIPLYCGIPNGIDSGGKQLYVRF